MRHYFGPSIAAVRRRDDGGYVTSIGRPIDLSVSISPAGLAPLIEWRIPDGPAWLGAATAARRPA